MNDRKNMHTSNLGWFVWVENSINNIQMMSKSLIWIFLGGMAAMTVAAIITTSLGIWEADLSFDFYLNFFFSTFTVIFNAEKRELWSRALDAILWDQFKMFLVHLPIAAVVWYQLFLKAKEKSSEMADTKFIKGTKIVPESVRIAEIVKAVEANKIAKPLFEIGRIPMPREAECNHTLIVASSGGGKGVLLTKIMRRAGSLKNIKAVCHDIKPEWALMCYREDRGDLIFNPLDARSVKWTVWNDIVDIMDIKNFALWIVPSSGDPKGAFWEDSARGILESILLYLWENDQCTNSAIRTMINLTGEELSEVLRGKPGAAYALKADSLTTLKTRMQWVDFLPDGDFSLRKWVNEAPRGILFLSNTEKTKALFQPVLSLFINALGSIVLDMPDDRNRRIFFFLDEFTALTRLDKVIDLLKLGRSKGASIWLAFQDFQQLTKIYTKEDMYTIINNCKNVAIGQIKEPEAAKYLASRFGKQEFYEKSQTFSMGVADNRDGLSLNEQRKEDFVVKDADLINLEERKFFVMLNHLSGVTLTTADIINVPKIAEGFIPIKMTKAEQIAMVCAQDRAEFLKGKKQIEQEEDEEVEAVEARNKKDKSSEYDVDEFDI
jgi:type IV secretory pathway TraG/TraD family ATPase VirD4